MSVQVPFENECCSTTEKQLRRYFELWNETLRQVCKTSVNIVCSYIHNLLVMHFRCLLVSCALRVMFVEKTIRVMWKWFETFLHVLIILIWVVLWKNIFVEFFIIKHQSTKHQRKTSMLEVPQIFSLQENKKKYSGSLNAPQNLKPLPIDNKVQ